MATGTLLPWIFAQLFDNNGDPLALGTITFTGAGLATPLATYTDVGLTVAHTNPVVLDSAGRPPSAIYLTPGNSYKAVLKNAAGSILVTWDNIAATPSQDSDLDITGKAFDGLAATSCVYLRTDGTWDLADATTAAKSTTPRVIGFAVTDIASGGVGAIRIQGRMTGFAGLSAGAPYYVSTTPGVIGVSPATEKRVVGTADHTGLALIILPNPSFATLAADAGLFVWPAFGVNQFVAAGAADNSLFVENTTSGTTARAVLSTKAGSTNGYLIALSQAYTTAGRLVQSGISLEAAAAGGLSIAATHASGALRFYTGSATLRGTITAAGGLEWVGDPITTSAAAGGFLVAGASGLFGFAGGSGGTVVQGAGSGKATGVTLERPSGAITMDGAALAAGAIVSFTLTNALIGPGDDVRISHVGVGTAGAYTITVFPGTGTAVVSVRNNTAGSLSEAILLRLTLIKGALA
jgi:hypothetical protein